MLTWALLIWIVVASLVCLNYGLSVVWLDLRPFGYVWIGLAAVGMLSSACAMLYQLRNAWRFKRAAAVTRAAKR